MNSFSKSGLSSAQAANDYIVAPNGGDITGAELSAKLSAGDVTLQSSKGSVIINDVVAWSADTTLTLVASHNVTINAEIAATGDTAGLVLSPNSANGAEPSSGNGQYIFNVPAITLSGATPTLTIAGTSYTVINALGQAGDVTTPPANPTLQGMAATKSLSGHFALGSDIDASATSSWNDGKGFTPIGSSNSPFLGMLDGLGHTIHNLTINQPIAYITSGTNINIGLFGVVGKSNSDAGIVQNIGLSGGVINGNLFVGALVGENYGTISNSYAAVTINGGRYSVGGLVGQNMGTIENSYATGNVTVEYVHSSGMYSEGIGGLAGKSFGTINNCHATGDVKGGYSIGGLVGKSNVSHIDNSYSTSNVDGINMVGGLVGELYAVNGHGNSTVRNSYAMGSVKGSSNVGGLVGQSNSYAGVMTANSVINSYSTGSVQGEKNNIGGLIGAAQPDDTVSDSYWDKSTSGLSTSAGGLGLTSDDMKTAASFKGFTFTSKPGEAGWVIIDVDGTLNNANGAAGATYPIRASKYSTTISNAHQLQLMALAPDASYRLSNDIIVLDTAVSVDLGFLPIGTSSVPFSGSFDGKNYTISNLTINRSDLSGVGLFGQTSGATIKNVGLVEANVNGHSQVGGLVGVMNGGTLVNSYVMGRVTGSAEDVGGLVGSNGSTISNCYAKASVSGAGGGVGGLVGHNADNGQINQSYAAGSVAGSGSNVGGLLGENTGSVTSSYWDTTVSGQSKGIGAGTTTGANGLSTAQMQSSSAFSGWNIADNGGSSEVWRIYQGKTMPLLRSFLTPIEVMPVYDGSAQQLNKVSDHLFSISHPVSGALSGEASGLTLSSSPTADTYTATFDSTDFYSHQLGYDIQVVSRTIVNCGTPADDLNIDSPLSWSEGTLTLEAQGNININASLSVPSSGGLALYYGQGSRAEGSVSDYFINAPINLRHGSKNYTTKLGWDGEVKTYQIIRSLGQPGIQPRSESDPGLLGINHNLSGNYALGCDLDAGVTHIWNNRAGFTPINGFGGQFDGLGHKIHGIYINAPTTDDVGLFGNTVLGASIKNLGLIDSEVNGANNVGALVGYLNGSVVSNSYATGSVTGVVGHKGAGNNIGGLVGFSLGKGTSRINNCYASGPVSGGTSVGGLVGHNSGEAGTAPISNSHASGQVSGINDAGGLVGFNGAAAGSAPISSCYATASVSARNQVGGLVGILLGGDSASASISTSYATGKVSGANNVGGLVGQVEGNGLSEATITSSYSVSQVNGTQANIGGLVGLNSGGQVNTSYATGTVSGFNNIGGLVGQMAPNGKSEATITSSYSVGQVKSTQGNVGGLVGLNSGGKVNAGYWNTASSGQSSSAGGSGLSERQMKSIDSFIGFNRNNWVIVDYDGTVNNADHADGATYPILRSEYSTLVRNAHQLQLMTLNPDAEYTLISDIDATGTAGSGDVWSDAGFVPVGGYATPFTGRLDGRGQTISNLTIDQHKLNRVGLFGIVGTSAVVENTVLSGGTVTGSSAGGIGSLVGINNGTVSNSSASIAVKGVKGGFVGGLIGSNTGTLTNDHASGSVSGTGGFRGGLVGVNSGTIDQCSASGNVGGQGGFTGPLVGYNKGTVH